MIRLIYLKIDFEIECLVEKQSYNFYQKNISKLIIGHFLLLTHLTYMHLRQLSFEKKKRKKKEINTYDLI